MPDIINDTFKITNVKHYFGNDSLLVKSNVKSVRKKSYLIQFYKYGIFRLKGLNIQKLLSLLNQFSALDA